MIFLRKFLLLLLVAASMAVTSTAALSAGKIENATMAEVEEAINATIKNCEEALAALDSGAEKDVVLGLMKTAKQSAKRIESPRLGLLRGKASSRMRKARTALKKGETDAAKEFLVAGIEQYKEILDKFLNF